MKTVRRAPEGEVATWVRWQREKLTLLRESREHRRAVRRLGYPPLALGALEPSPLDEARELMDAPSGPARPTPAGSARRRATPCFATVSTVDHSAFARTLVASLRAHHPGAAVFVLVVDDRERSAPEEASGATWIPGPALGFPPHPFLALKLDATELCCAAKPFLVDYLMRHRGFPHVVYLDADQLVFRPLDALIRRLEEADFVVTPHLTEPFPHPERTWERPYLGTVAAAGVFNAGLFGVRATEAALRFLARWREMVTEVGAFSGARGLQHEQNAFNWVIAFTERVHVLRHRAYNVAYWNLHERSLRRSTIGTGPSWTVDGEPLVTFHFSGYSPEEPLRLSRHDTRHSAYCHTALAEILEHYHRELGRHQTDPIGADQYGFGELPSGIEIDPRMRRVFKVHELQLLRSEDPWTPQGERLYCQSLLRPVPGSGSLLPALLDEVYSERPDLRALSPQAPLDPAPLIRWFAEHGARELGYESLLDTHRPVIPLRSGVATLEKALEASPALLRGLVEPLGADRSRLIDRLLGAQMHDLATSILRLDFEIWHLSTVWAVRQLVARRSDLRRSYPDLLSEDAVAFSHWLDLCGTKTDGLPSGMGRIFRRATRGSLARIYSFVSRDWSLMRAFPLAFVGETREAFALTLLRLLETGPEYDLEDVVMYQWLMDEKPWSGVAPTLELAGNGHGPMSPRTVQGQEALLAPVLHRDHRFREALEAYRKRWPEPSRGVPSSPDVKDPDVLALLARRNGGPPRRDLRSPNAPRNGQTGLNVFGYFKSPIGLGRLSRGLVESLRAVGVEVRENVLGNLAMDDDLRLDDLVGRFDPSLGTNLFVSYPHLGSHLLRMFPDHVVAGRRNVAYLAWEQAEANPLWREIYADYDQVWALSGFAAAGLSACLGREVRVVPCALDPATLPAAASKAQLGLEDRRTVFLYVLDANSSIERKNPEAAVEAFRLAFRPDDHAQLVLRVANAHRPEHLPRLRRLEVRAREAELDVRFLTRRMSRAEVLRLISAADCYVSLHRAEGFGVTCAEAMAFGRPTIATGYSGNLEFMSRDNSLLVDYEEVEVEVPEGPFVRGSIWAEPSVRHAAELMREVYDHPEEVLEVARRGRETVERLLAPVRVGGLAAGFLNGPTN